MTAAVRNGIVPILCVGETREERNLKETRQVLHDQIVSALSDLTGEDVEQMVIAYEPVWAIGGHAPATPEDIEQAVNWLRYQVSELYGEKVENRLRVLYGGSDEPEFVSGIMGVEGVDGLLVGHASLNAEQFADIVEGVHIASLSED